MDKVWWNHITKAHKFFEDIVETAVKGSSMLLSLPASVPWKETLIEMIGERLQLENPKNAFQKISCGYILSFLPARWGRGHCVFFFPRGKGLPL